MHILRGTDLGELYLRQMHGARGCDEIPDANDAAEQPAIQVLSMDAYIDLILDCVVHLSPDITIHRLTGDGPKELLLAPLWSSKKRTVLNTIHSRMREEAIWQGKYFSEQ